MKLLLILEEAKLSKGTIEFSSYTTREEHLKNITVLTQKQGAQYLPDRYQHVLNDFGYAYIKELDDFIHLTTREKLYGKRESFWQFMCPSLCLSIPEVENWKKNSFIDSEHGLKLQEEEQAFTQYQILQKIVQQRSKME